MLPNEDLRHFGLYGLLFGTLAVILMARQKYIDRYIASQTIYYNEESPQKHADIIIDNNDVASPFLVK